MVEAQCLRYGYWSRARPRNTPLQGKRWSAVRIGSNYNSIVSLFCTTRTKSIDPTRILSVYHINLESVFIFPITGEGASSC
jgi:hypothetical protein